MVNGEKKWVMGAPAICLIFAAILAAGPAGATTFEMTKTHYWSQYQITKNDTVIVDTGATLTVDVGDLYGDAVCSAITVRGTLQFGTDPYNEPGHLIVYNSFFNDGLITPSTDTSFTTSNIFQIDIVGGMFYNNAVFEPKVFNGSQSANEQIDMGFSGSSGMSVGVQTTFTDLEITGGDCVLNGTLECHELYLYGKLERVSGSLYIDNNGIIFRNDSGSISFAPYFGSDVSITYSNFSEMATGPELDTTVDNLTISSDLILTKSVKVTGTLGGGGSQARSYLHTGSDTVTVPDYASIVDAGIDGNLSRIYTTKDSLVFSMIGDETGIVSQPLPPNPLDLFVPRPIAIKLNNLNGGPDTITVAFHDTLMKPTALPSGVVALERKHYWSVGASPNYAGHVDANVSLTWYDDTYFPGYTLRRDYLNEKSLVTVMRGNAATGEWNVADNSLGVSTQAYGADREVTGQSFKAFGDFTLGELSGLPNGDFEDWTIYGLYGWTSNNTAFNTFILQSSNAHSGSSAAEGVTIADTASALSPDLRLVLPTEVVPGALDGYYRFIPSVNDKFFVSVKAYKDSAVVAQGSFTDSNAVMSYQPFRVNIFPVPGMSDSLTDSLTIDVTLLPGDSGVFHTGTSYLVDDFSFGKLTSVSWKSTGVPAKFRLFQNYPNPFNPTTTIVYDVPRKSNVDVSLYDILGRKVAVLVSGERSSGEYRVVFNGSRFASGVYFCRMQAGNFSSVKKLMLIK